LKRCLNDKRAAAMRILGCACGKVEYWCCYVLMRIINEKLK